MEKKWGLIGHQTIVNFLEKSLFKNKLAHTYLFYGISHLGKTTLAKKFAEKLLNSDSTFNPDLFELKLDDNSKEIKIDQVRDWQRFISLKPFVSGYKVAIIHQAECLNRESANALLKTIEEPPEKTIIILITSSWQKLLPTIVSRSQQIHFLPVSSKIIEEEVNGKIKDHQIAQEILVYSSNRPGLAIKFCEDQEFRKNYQKFSQEVAKLENLPISKRFDYLEKYLKDNKDNNESVKDFLNHLEFILRKKLLIDYSINKSQAKKTVKLLVLLEKTKALLRFNIQPRLLFENLLINL